MRVIGHLLDRLHRDERGSVLLIIFSFLPVAVAVSAFVIDFANGAEHRRHLQLQADAGVLAAAQEFNGCFLDHTAANADIEAEALSYSGEDHNPQIGASDAQARVTAKINATGYGAASYSAGEPCATGIVDLRLTEADSPPFFAFVGDNDYRAHARVKVFTLSSMSKMMPIAVPDPDPKVAEARFVDESTGTVLASTSLKRNGSQNGNAIWDNSSAPVAVPITADHVGLRIALGGQTSTTCGDQLVRCYDLSSANKGLVHIRGWRGAGTDSPASALAPVARSVTLTPGTCPDPYFVNAAVSCTIGVNATVDFGPTSPTALGATVSATVAGQSYPLTFSAGTWSTSGAIPVPPQAGFRDVGLHWQITKMPNGSNCNGGQCRGDIAAVHRTLSKTSAIAGPIELAQVAENGIQANTFQRCSAALTSCTHNLVVKIGVSGGLELSTAGGPPVHLRVTVGEGSQTQSLDCDPNISNLRDELSQGCAPTYRIHEETDPACPANPSTLWARPNPPAWDCVAVEPGDKVNQVAQGLKNRIFGSTQANTCTHPNHWPNWQPGDPRIVFVMITPFGTLAGNGNSITVPVMRFAAFYVTGFTGNGSGSNPCLPNGGDETPSDAGDIVGRFINYIETPNNGGGEEESCDFSALDPCVAVMVE